MHLVCVSDRVLKAYSKESTTISVHNVSGLEQSCVFIRLGTKQRLLASAGQRGTREEKTQGGKVGSGGQGMENVRRNFGGGSA